MLSAGSEGSPAGGYASPGLLRRLSEPHDLRIQGEPMSVSERRTDYCDEFAGLVDVSQFGGYGVGLWHR
jgi:hypothetical protein